MTFHLVAATGRAGMSQAFFAMQSPQQNERLINEADDLHLAAHFARHRLERNFGVR
jgi:hypothetical protein